MNVPSFAEKVWLNEAFRAFVAPEHKGQIGFQESDGSKWEAMSDKIGNWQPA